MLLTSKHVPASPYKEKALRAKVCSIDYSAFLIMYDTGKVFETGLVSIFEVKLENEDVAIALSRCHQNLKSANHIVVVLQSTAARK